MESMRLLNTVHGAELDLTNKKPVMISDGFGNYWSVKCPACGGEIEVVRPGKAQCSGCTA